MSIPGDAPHYILAEKRSDGLIDYAVFNPRGWTADELVYKPSCAATDERQIIGRSQHKLLASQNGIAEIEYISDLQSVINGLKAT